MRLKLFLISMLFAITLGAFSQTKKGTAVLESSSNNFYENTRALIIGISSYKNLSDEKQLNYADDDAQAFYQFFSSRPDVISPENMVILLNEEATKREYIESLLENFIVNESNPGDLVILYFSGHAAIQNPDATVDQGYLLLNGAPDDGDYASPSSDVISINFLQELITKVNDGVDVLFIIDACHSGKLINQASNNEKVMVALQNKWEDTYKLASCQSNQSSLEGPQWGDGHGVFTYHLLFGLNGMADLEGNNDNVLMFEEIYDYVKNNVKKDTKYQQLPRFEGDGSINFISVDKNQLDVALNAVSNYTGTTSPMLAMTASKGVEYFYDIPDEAKSDFNTFTKLVNENKLIPYTNSVFPEYNYVLANLDLARKSKMLTPGINKIEFSENGNYLLTYSGDQITVFNPQSQQKVNSFDRKGLNNLLIKENTAYLLYDETIEKRNAEGSMIASNNLRTPGKLSAVSPNGKLVAVSNGQNVDLLNTKNLSNAGDATNLPDMEIDYLYFSSDSVLLLKDKNNRLVNYDFRNNLILSHRQLDGEVVSLGPLPAENRLVVVYDNKTQILKMDWLTKEWENDTIKPSTNTSVSATQYPHILMIKSGNKVSLFNAIYGKYTSEFNITSNITCAATGGSYYAVLMEEGDIFISRISYGGKKTTRKEEPNAYPYFQKLMASYHLKHLHDRLKNYYIARLINYSNNVIEPLIAGEISNETNTDLVYAEQCLNLAESLNVESVLINRKIEISRQLISVFSELITYNYDNYQKAITNLKELIQLYPDASYSLNTMSRIYLRLNEILNAQKTSIHAINNNPFWSEPRISYARSLIKNNEYYKALETLDSVCHQFPESRNACLLSGDVYLFLGNFDRANLFYGKADSIDSDAYSMSKLAQVLILQRKYRDAIVMLENTIVQNGGSPYASLMLGKLYLHIYFEALNDLNINSEYFHVAITNLEDANRLGPESPHIKLEYLKLALTEFNGMLVLAQKKQNSSSQPTSPFTAQDYKSRMTNDAHRVYENKEEIQNDLLYNARKLLKSDPYYYPTYKLIADILASMGRTKEALEMFDQAISENPEVADLYYFKGMFLADMRKTTEASPYFEKAIQKDIDFLPAYYAYFKAFTTDKKGKAIDINTIKSEEAKRLLNQARERFGNDIFKDSRSINYSKAVPFFFDQIYFY